MPPQSLYRLAGLAGLISGIVLLFNTLRRTGVVPDNSLTHGIAPISATLALFALTGIYLLQREQTGRLGLYGYAINMIGMAGVVGIEVTTNHAFPYLDQVTIDRLLEGPTLTAFLVVAVVYVVGAVLFGAAIWRGGVYPRAAAALYIVGAIPVGLRNAVPLPVYVVGLVLTVATVIWLSVLLIQIANRSSVSGPAGSQAYSGAR